MKFRIIRRIIYLKRARHRRGHGIHSPFLFRLITEVVENKRKFPEYKIFKDLKENAMNILEDSSEPSLAAVYHQFNLPPANPHRLYRKVELPLRYAKVVFRLLREFKPLSVMNYGPTMGANLALMAMANKDSLVYQYINDAAYEQISNNLLKYLTIPNVRFFNESSVPTDDPPFLVINYPYNPAVSHEMVRKRLDLHGDDDVMIIRGIHESKAMEAIWQEMIDSESVRISLDLFEVGIVLFRKGLQKENFIFKF